MVRSERAEKLMLDKRLAYEADHDSIPNHWVDTIQTVANGCQCSEVGVSEDCRDELEDTVVDDVALGVKLGRQMTAGDQVFFGSVDDSDGRHLHFFFVAQSEDTVVEKLIAAFTKEEP